MTQEELKSKEKASPLDAAVISCTELFTGGAHNAVPSNVEILGDTRSCTPQIQKLIEDRMRAICENICHMNGAECEFTYTHEFAPTVNWDQCVQTAVVGADKVKANCVPWMVSEDFGTFLTRIPGCSLFLGSRKYQKASDNIMCHNSQYDYNDNILVTGAEFFTELIAERLPITK